jgi:hypothetical protein
LKFESQFTLIHTSLLLSLAHFDFVLCRTIMHCAISSSRFTAKVVACHTIQLPCVRIGSQTLVRILPCKHFTSFVFQLETGIILRMKYSLLPFTNLQIYKNISSNY